MNTCLYSKCSFIYCKQEKMKKQLLYMFLFFFAFAFAWCWVYKEYTDSEWNKQMKELSEFNWYEWLSAVDSCEKFVREALWNKVVVSAYIKEQETEFNWEFWKARWITAWDSIDFNVLQDWKAKEWYCMIDKTVHPERNWVFAIYIDWEIITFEDLK